MYLLVKYLLEKSSTNKSFWNFDQKQKKKGRSKKLSLDWDCLPGGTGQVSILTRQTTFIKLQVKLYSLMAEKPDLILPQYEM